MVAGLTLGNRTTAKPSVDRPVELAAFFASGIDDLAKYRIVERMLRNPKLAADAQYFANELGLRPVQQTSLLLDQMVGSGLLAMRQFPCWPGTIYTLTADKKSRRELRRLYADHGKTESREFILARLASESISRVKTWASQRGQGKASLPLEEQHEAKECLPNQEISLCHREVCAELSRGKLVVRCLACGHKIVQYKIDNPN